LQERSTHAADAAAAPAGAALLLRVAERAARVSREWLSPVTVRGLVIGELYPHEVTGLGPVPIRCSAIAGELLRVVVKYDNMGAMAETRPVSWVKAARKEFEKFPEKVQTEGLRALTIAAEGSKADSAKPLHGLGSGVLEIVLNDRSGTYRVIYAVQIGDDLWVVHAFQKKSKKGIKTPQQEIDLIRQRLKRLKEILA
jgi:phage-related protein